MKDEIREILDNPKTLQLSYGNYASLDDYFKLRDFITNLQQELKEANESIIWWSNRFKAVERDNRDYKSRIEKAVEYIKNNISWYYDEDLDESIYQDVVNGDDLLNILQNGSDE